MSFQGLNYEKHLIIWLDVIGLLMSFVHPGRFEESTLLRVYR